VQSLLLLFVMSCAVAGQMSSRLEQSICGFKEPLVFWLWSNAAGSPDASRLAGIKNVEDISINTRDGRILRGYKLGAAPESGGITARRGYLLVAQGNAMLADQIIGSFTDIAGAGYDVFAFDYRGYGRSEGKRRLKAILSDYGEIINYLDSDTYPERLFYGMSFGGIVLLNATGQRTDVKRVVIDSAPSRLSDYGCPEKHDPVVTLPQDSSNYLFVVGLKDRVVKPESSKELVEKASQRGASVLQDPEFAHPFMDRDIFLHRRRMDAVREFLLGNQAWD